LGVEALGAAGVVLGAAGVVSGAAGVVSGAAGVVSGAAGLVLGAEVVTVVDPGESTAVTASIRLTNGECIGPGLGAAEAVGVCSEVFSSEAGVEGCEVLLFFPLLGPMVKVYSSSDVFSSKS
jgi:hypothetical protein